jgi:sterol desaturase/sphingolipid hydroxylase (fatty acid hydroxylase superfamily)
MTRWLDKALTYCTFPLVFGGSMTVAVVGMGIGWDPVITAMALTAAVVLALLVLERVHPYHEEWRRSHGDVRTDLLHNLVNFWIPEVYTVLFVGGVAALGGRLSESLGATLWPTSWHLVGQLLLALLVAELGTYWIHRLMHERAWLWRFHAPHHSAPRLYWLNAGRFHPLDLFSQQFLAVTPLVLLGADMRVIALLTLFTAIHGLFQHCNVDIRLGPLNWFFSMAELHRWHHSKRIEEANTNYGANVIFWDIVFGTRYLPVDRKPPTEIGIEALPDFPAGYWAHLTAPIRWKEIEQSAAPCYGSGDDTLRPSHD